MNLLWIHEHHYSCLETEVSIIQKVTSFNKRCQIWHQFLDKLGVFLRSRWVKMQDPRFVINNIYCSSSQNWVHIWYVWIWFYHWIKIGQIIEVNGVPFTPSWMVELTLNLSTKLYKLCHLMYHVEPIVMVVLELYQLRSVILL